MKILLAVNFAYNCQSGNEILLALWDRWASRYKDKIHCDLRFVIGGSNEAYKDVINQFTKHCHSCIVTDNQTLGYGWLNWPTLVDAYGYDFVFRLDHDAFITVDTLNSYCDYIQNNPHIDFFSPSNTVRPWSILENNSDVRRIIASRHPKNPNVASYTPWNQVGYNGDLCGIKRSFFLQALKNYENDLNCIRNSSWTSLGHFTMTFGHVCDLLHYKNSAITEIMKQCHPAWDGVFGTDIWTHMCALGMKSAGVATENKESFLFKNSLKFYYEAKKFDSWQKVRDKKNILWPREDNIYGATDLFHLENGYMLNWYFNLRKGLPHTGNHIKSLQSKDDNFIIWSYCIADYFTRVSNLSNLQALFQKSKEDLMTYYQVDMNKWLPLEEELIAFYYPVLKEYL